jgi:hypothetical protein
MRRALVIFCAASLAALASSASFDADTAAAKSCKRVHAAGKEAYRIAAHNMSCRKTRKKLRRWMRTGFPQDNYGWYCDTRGEPKLCSGGNGSGAPYFTFYLRR